MSNQFLEFLVRKWRVEDDITRTGNTTFDLIIPISYTTGRQKLVNATEAIAREAIYLKKYVLRCALAEIVVSNCAYTFPNAAEVEWLYRDALFTASGIKAHRAGDMNNSVEEAQAIVAYVAKHGLRAKNILIVTGEMHTRSARWLWRRVMPNSNISITCIEHQLEYQQNHPVHVQRTAWRWFLTNIVRHLLLLTIGLRVGKWHHRSS